MTGFFDMHVHSTFSIDGVSTMEDYCLIAEKSGIRAICFTEHVDYNSEEKNLSIIKDNRKYNFVVEDYFCELNRLREKYSSIILLSGIEFSEPSLFPDEFALWDLRFKASISLCRIRTESFFRSARDNNKYRGRIIDI